MIEPDLSIDVIFVVFVKESSKLRQCVQLQLVVEIEDVVIWRSGPGLPGPDGFNLVAHQNHPVENFFDKLLDLSEHQEYIKRIFHVEGIMKKVLHVEVSVSHVVVVVFKMIGWAGNIVIIEPGVADAGESTLKKTMKVQVNRGHWCFLLLHHIVMKMITISLFIIKWKGNILDMQCDDIFGTICVLWYEQHRQEGQECQEGQEVFDVSSSWFHCDQ